MAQPRSNHASSLWHAAFGTADVQTVENEFNLCRRWQKFLAGAASILEEREGAMDLLLLLLIGLIVLSFGGWGVRKL
jgi:hypothetical protein